MAMEGPEQIKPKNPNDQKLKVFLTSYDKPVSGNNPERINTVINLLKEGRAVPQHPTEPHSVSLYNSVLNIFNNFFSFSDKNRNESIKDNIDEQTQPPKNPKITKNPKTQKLVHVVQPKSLNDKLGQHIHTSPILSTQNVKFITNKNNFNENMSESNRDISESENIFLSAKSGHNSDSNFKTSSEFKINRTLEYPPVTPQAKINSVKFAQKVELPENDRPLIKNLKTQKLTKSEYLVPRYSTSGHTYSKGQPDKPGPLDKHGQSEEHAKNVSTSPFLKKMGKVVKYPEVATRPHSTLTIQSTSSTPTPITNSKSNRKKFQPKFPPGKCWNCKSIPDPYHWRHNCPKLKHNQTAE